MFPDTRGCEGIACVTPWGTLTVPCSIQPNPHCGEDLQTTLNASGQRIHLRQATLYRLFPSVI